MTKLVRVENADTSNYIIVVQVWEKGAAESPDIMVSEFMLEYPAMLQEVYIHSTRYIVVKEVTSGGQ